MSERRKQITFDLNQELLKKNYPRKRLNLSEDYYLKAYRDIKRYMLKNGFKWIQQSVYESKKPMGLPELFDFMEKMGQGMPWLHTSANDIVASEVISKKYNIKAFLQGSTGRNRNNTEMEDYDDVVVQPKSSIEHLIGAAEKEKCNEKKNLFYLKHAKWK